MGEAKRKAEARQREGMTVMPISKMPDDIKHDIAAVASAVSYIAVGGTCHFRSVAGMYALKLAGIEAHRCIGGMIYRAGPNESSDVLAFCGPGNVGRFKDGNFMGHMWVRAGDALIDFSPGDWRNMVDAFGPLIDDGFEKLDRSGGPPIRQRSSGDRGTASCHRPASTERRGRRSLVAPLIPASTAQPRSVADWMMYRQK